MKARILRHRKILIVFGLLLLGAALVWAAAELSGQANAIAQDAGGNSADMEMVSLRAIQKPSRTKASPAAPPPCDWKKERDLNRKIEANDAQYKKLLAKAKQEQQRTGAVSPGTASAMQKSAAAFNQLCQQYAAMWDQCNCTTRAKLARESGQTRVQSAAVASQELDTTRLDNLGSAQDRMKAARREYARKVTEDNELGDAEKTVLRTQVLPQAKSLVTQATNFLKRATDFLRQVQKSIQGGGSNGGGGGGGGEGAGGGFPTVSLTPAQQRLSRGADGLVRVGRNMLSNVQALATDVQAMITGEVPPDLGLLTGMMPGACFVESSDQ